MPKLDSNSPCTTCELPRHMRHCMESKHECRDWNLYQKDKKKELANE